MGKQMSTTVVFVEFLIAGMQASVWLVLIFFSIFGLEPISRVSAIVHDFSALSTLVLIALWYTLGIIIDQIGNVIFTLLNIPSVLARGAFIRWLLDNRPVLTARTAVLAEAGNVAAFLDYNRSRIRIMRATTLNFCMIEISLGILFIVYPDLFWEKLTVWQVATSIIAGAVATGACIVTLIAVEVGYDVYLRQIRDARMIESKEDTAISANKKNAEDS